MKKPEKLLKAELQKIKDDTEVEYKDRIAASVEASRKALVAQRIAFFEAEEKKKEEERKAALLAELEAEAADLFKHSV